MENAVDALKMAGAAILFILAFSIAMTMFTKARDTSDAVLARLEHTKYLEKVTPLKNNITREVGIETVIPTIYRYSQSDDNIRVRIMYTKNNGEEAEHQIFDTQIEDEIKTAVGQQGTITPYHARLKAEYNDSRKPAYLFEAPWAYSKNQVKYRAERIDAYIYGTKTKHMEVDYSTTADGGVPRGLLNLINYVRSGDEDAKIVFEESYVEHNFKGTVEKDEYGEEIVTKPVSSISVITYKIKKKVGGNR